MARKKVTRAAVVLFVEVDQDIPAHHVSVLVSQKLGASGLLAEPFSLSRGEQVWNVKIHDVVEAGMAAGNGYLRTSVTSKAFPREEEEG